MTDILIIGSGPAGISAALYAARAGMDTLVISSGQSALFKAHMIENYYGGSISGDELYEKGIAQAKALGIEIKEDQVVGLVFDGDFIVTGEKSQYKAKAVIIATGSSRKAPPLPGLSEFEGRGVSYCAVCDGFFHRGKNVAVLGSGTYALHEAMELSPIAESVTILTDGQAPEFSLPDSVTNISVDTGKIKELTGEELLSSVVFEDDKTLDVSGVFVAIGTAGSSDLARKLGAVTEGTKIAVNGEMATNIPGLYAAGDCTPGMLQVAKAVYQGAEAATSAIKFVRSQNK
ncbi:MAG TPA: NAD(P)/FAD-dependent oxidoreductase [Candidatus Eubacterium pullicola]|nr:NAD(P)/FAD-dependent oxidoreductase [Candidatus Eubacterium pullicola]